MTTQRTLAAQLSFPVHSPKVETFDLEARINIDPKQIPREVEEYRLEPFGLYMARPMLDHPRLRYVESWLLPAAGLRISHWDWHPGHEPEHDFYVDVVDIEPGPVQWRCLDRYLDIEVGDNRFATLVDLDEFLLAVQGGLLDTDTAQRALETAYRCVDGLARHGYNLAAWLHAQGIVLSWRA